MARGLRWTTIHRMGRSSLLTMLAAALASLPSTASPADAYYTADPNRLFWIVHVSDTHIGTDWYNEDGRFFWMLQEALPIIQPALVVVTGDLVDGSRNGIPTTGQDREEWQRYRAMLDQTGLSADFYVDLPGNHDTYNDDLSYYREWSLNGSTYGKTTRAMLLEFDFGTYFLYGCSTPGDSAGPFVDPAGFSQTELDEMQQMLEGNTDANLILVFGHHPPSDPDRADEARAMWRQAGAQYFHGHTHLYEEYIYDGIVTRQVNSLGKSRNDNLAVIAIDGDFITYEVTGSDDPWPMIVITAPADARLQSGDENPYAYPVPVNCPGAPVRALVFDSVPVERVWMSAGGGPDIELRQDENRPMLWLGEWSTNGLSGGEMQLVVSASDGRTRSRSITVRLETGIACPGPWEPDGEPADEAGTEPAEADGGTPDDYEYQQGDYVSDGGSAGENEPADAGQAGEGSAESGGEVQGEHTSTTDETPLDDDPRTDSGCGCSMSAVEHHRWGLPAVVLVFLALCTRRRGGRPSDGQP